MSENCGLVLPFERHTPRIHKTARVMPTAVVIGDVELEREVGIWFGSVIRGDVHSIRIGARTNIQDGSVIHVTDGKFGTEIGEDVTVGHRAMLHGCKVGHGSLVGMNSTVLDGAILEEEVFLGAGSLVTPGTILPTGTLCLGRPAKPIRDLDEEMAKWMKYSAYHYIELMRRYSPLGTLPA
tara:strand:- start:7 stop:549 length:543 start_codon:yes stop_codon:yes gene_type:complete